MMTRRLKRRALELRAAERRTRKLRVLEPRALKSPASSDAPWSCEWKSDLPLALQTFGLPGRRKRVAPLSGPSDNSRC